jgi:hypothetical protein
MTLRKMNLIEDFAMVSLPFVKAGIVVASTEESEGIDNNGQNMAWQGCAPAASDRKVRERTRGLPPSP